MADLIAGDQMRHVYAPVHSGEHQSLDGLVVFELVDADGQAVHLAIRYLSFRNQEIEGDHLYVEGLEAAKADLEAAFDIAPSE
jgi:hypothetical protein